MTRTKYLEMLHESSVYFDQLIVNRGRYIKRKDACRHVQHWYIVGTLFEIKDTFFRGAKI